MQNEYWYRENVNICDNRVIPYFIEYHMKNLKMRSSQIIEFMAHEFQEENRLKKQCPR